MTQNHVCDGGNLDLDEESSRGAMTLIVFPHHPANLSFFFLLLHLLGLLSSSLADALAGFQKICRIVCQVD